MNILTGKTHCLKLPRKLIKMIHAIALKFGYVESCSVSWTVFQAEFITPKDKKKCFQSLAEFLYKRYKEVVSRQVNKMKNCCKENAQFINNHYCCQCGTYIRYDEFSYLEWVSFLNQIREADSDSFGWHDPGEEENPYGWDPFSYFFNLPKKNMIIVPENAAEMLSFALAEIHPELKEEIDQCTGDHDRDDYEALFRK